MRLCPSSPSSPTPRTPATVGSVSFLRFLFAAYSACPCDDGGYWLTVSVRRDASSSVTSCYGCRSSQAESVVTLPCGRITSSHASFAQFLAFRRVGCNIRVDCRAPPDVGARRHPELGHRTHSHAVAHPAEIPRRGDPEQAIPLTGDRRSSAGTRRSARSSSRTTRSAASTPQITAQNGAYFIEDLKSRNHTFVNSKEVAGRRVAQAGRPDQDLRLPVPVPRRAAFRSRKPLPDGLRRRQE